MLIWLYKLYLSIFLQGRCYWYAINFLLLEHGTKCTGIDVVMGIRRGNTIVINKSWQILS